MGNPAVSSSVLLNELPTLTRAEAMALATSQNDGLLSDLKKLAPADWERPTDCVGWSVRDIVAHVLGWAEAMTSVREGMRQTIGAVRRRKDFSSLVDAQNEVQVEGFRWLAKEELLARLELALPRFVKVRNKLGPALRHVPYASGPTGRTTLGFIAEHIFTRDVLMHRIDIARAVDQELSVGPDERRILEDCFRDWATTEGVDATLELTGACSGRYVGGSGRAATIKADSIDLCRWFTGRGSTEPYEITGDKRRAEAWIDAGVKF